MGLDVLLFRQEHGGNPELVRESQRRRFKPEDAVNAVIEADNKWRQGLVVVIIVPSCAAVKYDLDKRLTEKNALQKEISEMLKVSNSLLAIHFTRK